MRYIALLVLMLALVGCGVEDSRTQERQGGYSFSLDPNKMSSLSTSSSPAAGRKGMTWGVWTHGDVSSEFVNPDCEGRPGEPTASGHNCDPYQGDTVCTATRRLLCVRDMGTAVPDVRLNNNTYHGWFGGDVDTSIQVRGTDLTSRAVADQICASNLGPAWRMAEFHDGRGWGFWARGHVNMDSRFWVAINDKRANCWDN